MSNQQRLADVAKQLTDRKAWFWTYLADVILDRPIQLAGATFAGKGTTTLRIKIAWLAENLHQILTAVRGIFDVKVELQGNHGTDKTTTTLRTTLGWVAHHFRTLTLLGQDILAGVVAVHESVQTLHSKLDQIITLLSPVKINARAISTTPVEKGTTDGSIN